MLLPLFSRYRIWLLLFRYQRLCPPLFPPVLNLCFLLSAPSKAPRSVPPPLWTRSPPYQWAALPLSLAACTQRPHWNFPNPRKASFQAPRWNTLGHLGLNFVSPFSLNPVTVSPVGSLLSVLPLLSPYLHLILPHSLLLTILPISNLSDLEVTLL